MVPIVDKTITGQCPHSNGIIKVAKQASPETNWVPISSIIEVCPSSLKSDFCDKGQGLQYL